MNSKANTQNLYRKTPNTKIPNTEHLGGMNPTPQTDRRTDVQRAV